MNCNLKFYQWQQNLGGRNISVILKSVPDAPNDPTEIRNTFQANSLENYQNVCPMNKNTYISIEEYDYSDEYYLNYTRSSHFNRCIFYETSQTQIE